MTQPTSPTTPLLDLPDGLPAWQSRAAVQALARITVDPETGCWLSTWYADSAGYTWKKAGGKMRRVHRLICASVNGIDYDTLTRDDQTLHSCDRPGCCNPGHLRFGSNSDNVRDAVVRGRHAYGEHIAKLKRRTHCPRGHRLTGANLVPTKLAAGMRTCQICNRARARAHGKATRVSAVPTFEEAVASELARTDNGRDIVARDALS